MLKATPALRLLAFLCTSTVRGAFWTPLSHLPRLRTVAASAARSSMDASEIKEQLTKYLQVRKEANADEEAKRLKGTVVGGTKGNKILDYVSGAPVKAKVIEQAPNVFDYDELSKYGFGNLVTPIMNFGGRRAAYELMGMEFPNMVLPPTDKPAPKIVIDRTGESDAGRYKGLKLMGSNDDDAIAAALQAAQERTKRGEKLRPKIEEGDYVAPFADKRNTGPKMTPVWTPERLDEYGKARGRAESWVRRAKMGEFVSDADESVLEVDLTLRMYCVFTAAIVSVALGRSTPAFLERFASDVDAVGLIGTLQAPATALALAGVGSSVVCAVLLAPPKKRNSAVWAFKGLLGGPLAISQLRRLDALVTREEQQQG